MVDNKKKGWGEQKTVEMGVKGTKGKELSWPIVGEEYLVGGPTVEQNWEAV